MSVFLPSCKNNTDQTNYVNDSTHVSGENLSVIVNEPANMQVYTHGDIIQLEAVLPESKIPDSAKYTWNGNIQKIEGNKISGTIATDSAHAGKNYIVINAWNGGKQYTTTVTVTIKSKAAPQLYSYKIVKRYPHDANAYTQGLIFDKGFIYEGTGQWGESNLRKYKLENGELIQSYNLPEDVFGEGIVVFNNHIYQLTWQSHVAYEYEKESFKLINKFDFSTEGWGITNLGNNLVMSDGSYTLYVLSPESFNEIKKIEVFDNIGPVNMLNELELIDGKIYANIYQTDNIVIINPSTGFVEGKISLSGLLDKSKVKDREPDVLNGIAWDEKGKRLLLTGKYWPEMYEVKLVKK